MKTYLSVHEIWASHHHQPAKSFHTNPPYNLIVNPKWNFECYHLFPKYTEEVKNIEDLDYLEPPHEPINPSFCVLDMCWPLPSARVLKSNLGPKQDNQRKIPQKLGLFLISNIWHEVEFFCRMITSINTRLWPFLLALILTHDHWYILKYHRNSTNWMVLHSNTVSSQWKTI